MRYLLIPLKLCFCNFKFPLKRCLGSITSFNACTKNVEKLDYKKIVASPIGSLVLKRDNHGMHVQQMPQNGSDNKTEQDSTEDSDFISITNNDPVLEKKLKILFLEVEVLRQSGFKVPQNVKLGQWKELLDMETRSRRRKYLSYLFGVEKKQENRKKKKDEQKQRRDDAGNTFPENTHLTYGLGHNTIFLRVYDTAINHFYNSKLIQAMQFSQKLVVDCSYDSHMTSREAQNCGKQLTLMFSDNRVHDNPFDLYICSAKRESNTIKQLVKFIPTFYDCDFPVNVTEKSYLDLFPKENIVYLTPHCREEMREFDHDAIYIIGAMVDKANNEPLSLAKAKREGLKMAKLPLDKYLMWGSGGSKSLTLNQMVRILLDIRASGSWDKALQHVPRRKVVTPKDLQETASKKIGKSKEQLHYTFKDRSKHH
jgi:ribonuclease P protein 1